MANIQGQFDPIAGRIASGWAVDLDAPGAAVQLAIFVGGERIGGVVAVTPAASPAPAGAKNFEFLLPASGFASDDVEVEVRVAATGTPLAGSPRPLKLAVQADEVVGSLDTVTSDGWVRGWACVKNRLSVRREVEIIAGTEVVGLAVADGYRQDLEKANIGDGRYAFAFALPFEVCAQPQEFLVAVRDKATGKPLGKPILFRPKPVADALAKVAALEADLVLLRSGMAALEAQARADTKAAAELFRTAGDFFIELGQVAAAGLPASALRSVRAAAAVVTETYKPLALDNGTAALSVCVICHGGAAPAYETLRAIAEDPAGLEIFLLDAGETGEIPLLPLVVPGLSYVRGGQDQVAALNHVLAAAAAPAVVFCAAGLLPEAGWAEAVLAGFNAAPQVVALAAQVLDATGHLAQAGMNLQEGQPVPRGQGQERGLPGFARAVPVDAAGAPAFALRRTPALQLGSLPAGFAGVDAALLSFSARARAQGAEIFYEPGFTVHMPHGFAPPPQNIAARAADADRLRAETSEPKLAAE
jgi:hypothetical protein